MDLQRSCREVTRLVLESGDRELTPTETLALQTHWRFCDARRKFRDQAQWMRQAMLRWRRYRDEDPPGGP